MTLKFHFLLALLVCWYSAPTHGAVCQWKLVFKAVSGNRRCVINDWLRRGGLNQNNIFARRITSTTVFRDGTTLDTWEQRAIERVKIHLYSRTGRRLSWFLYDGVGSTLKTWMSRSRLMASPFRKIKDDFQNFHSVLGDQHVSRPFYINRNYWGCPKDCGFLMTVDNGRRSGPCRFDRLYAKPYFLVGSIKSKCSVFESRQYIKADRLAIFVKECSSDI